MPDARSSRQYSAFISYSHADREWGEWLQRALERYVVPHDLRGRPAAAGIVPATLAPVFRDRWDLAAGPSLNAQIDEALRNAQSLVVLCSPASAKSAYVNEEIRRFKAMGREERIFSLIVGGRPGDAEHECFPEALVPRGPDGGSAASTAHPMAADARPEGDGRDDARLKIIAGLLGVPLDEIRKREQAYQRQQLRKARLTAGAMGVLAVLAAGSTGLALRANAERGQALTLAEERRREAELRYDQALNSSLRFVTTSATFRALLDGAEGRPAEFGVQQRQTKSDDNEFQGFLRESDPKATWLRLVDVLVRYEQDLPSELNRFGGDIEKHRLPVQWLRHAELIVGNLERRYGKEPALDEKRKVVTAELARHGEQPAAEKPCRPPVPAAAANIDPAETGPMQRAITPGCE